MTAHWTQGATRLTDRISERDALDRLIEGVQAGESRVLVGDSEAYTRIDELIS